MRWDAMNMAEMREFLGAFGLPTNGSRGELIARLNASTVADHCGHAAQAARRASTVGGAGGGAAKRRSLTKVTAESATETHVMQLQAVDTLPRTMGTPEKSKTGTTTA